MANYTEQQYQELCRAISAGQLEIEYDGKRVKYRSLSEMLQIKSMMENDMRVGGGQATRLYPVMSKGL